LESAAGKLGEFTGKNTGFRLRNASSPLFVELFLPQVTAGDVHQCGLYLVFAIIAILAAHLGMLGGFDFGSLKAHAGRLA
jgi:hypothetical protein